MFPTVRQACDSGRHRPRPCRLQRPCRSGVRFRRSSMQRRARTSPEEVSHPPPNDSTRFSRRVRRDKRHVAGTSHKWVHQRCLRQRCHRRVRWRARIRQEERQRARGSRSAALSQRLRRRREETRVRPSQLHLAPTLVQLRRPSHRQQRRERSLKARPRRETLAQAARPQRPRFRMSAVEQARKSST